MISLRTALQHLTQAPAVLVTVLDVKGSVPRGSGTRMLVFADRFAATIGGGHLEYQAIAHARRLLTGEAQELRIRHVLGPSLGQCCGGARVLALASTSELLKSASSNVLRFKLDGQLPPELAAKARITGRIVQFPAHDALEIETYLAAVRQAGLKAEDIEIRKADLEDVFLDVMAEGKS